MLFASDFWGILKMPQNKPIENLHMKFCKELLGARTKTNHQHRSTLATRANHIFSIHSPMAYYITWPDLLLVEFQFDMMHAIHVLNILLMNLYYRLMLCANIWKFFREYWRKYRHFAFWLQFIIIRERNIS